MTGDMLSSKTSVLFDTTFKASPEQELILSSLERMLLEVHGEGSDILLGLVLYMLLIGVIGVLNSIGPC